MFLNPLVIINVLDAQKIRLGTVPLVRLKTHGTMVLPFYYTHENSSPTKILTTKHSIFVNKSSCAVTFPVVPI